MYGIDKHVFGNRGNATGRLLLEIQKSSAVFWNSCILGIVLVLFVNRLWLLPICISRMYESKRKILQEKTGSELGTKVANVLSNVADGKNGREKKVCHPS